MTRRVRIPAEAKPSCECCARGPRSPWYDLGCRACLGRYVRTLQRQYRQGWYREAAEACGRDAVEAFIEDSVRA